MTDPINRISGTQGALVGGNYSGGNSSGDHRKKRTAEPQADLVEISQDARERASGKKRKSILDYFKELFG